MGRDKTTPELFDWTRKNDRRNNLEEPEPIITTEEYLKLLKACINPRDKAIISLLYESGLRIGELVSLKLRSIETDKHGFKVHVRRGKTGPRDVRVTKNGLAFPYVTDWKKAHPFREDGEAFLFTGLSRAPLDPYTHGLETL